MTEVTAPETYHKRIIPINVHRNISPSFFESMASADQLLVSSSFFTFQGEGPFTGHPAVFLRLAGCNIGAKEDCAFCFPEGETISTPDGVKQFKDIKIGDDLFTLDDSGKLTITKVEKVLTKNVSKDDLVRVEYEIDGSLHRLYCTKDHPFHTTKRGYVAASELTTDDELCHLKNGREIVAVQKTRKNPSFSQEIVKKGRFTFKTRMENGVYDLSRTDEQKANYARSKMGDNNPMKRHDVRLKSALGHNYPKSGLETTFEKVLNKAGIEHVYCGNSGKVVVGDNIDGYAIPDFVIGDKKIIEVYHTTNSVYKEGLRTEENYETPKRNFYKKFGFDVLFLTEKDIPSANVGSGNKAADSEHLIDYKPIQEKIGMFLCNGAKVMKVGPLSDYEFKRRKTSDTECGVVNFSCAPFNTFLVNKIHVHNCDTKFDTESAIRWGIDELATHLEVLADGKARLLVITGGEPLLQEAVLSKLIAHLQDKQSCFKDFQIETNGSYLKFDSFTYISHDTNRYFLQNVHVVVSPKASSSLGKYPKARETWYRQGSNGFKTYLKYVLSSDVTNLNYRVPDAVLLRSKETETPLYVSGMAHYLKAYPAGRISSIWHTDEIDFNQTGMNYRYTAEYALRHGLLVSYQQHLFGAVE